MVQLRLRFISHSYWAVWDLVLLPQLHHVNTYIESNTKHLLQKIAMAISPCKLPLKPDAVAVVDSLPV